MDYSEIWSQLAALENIDQEPDSSLVSEYICKCGGIKCMTDTVLTCTSCGVMDHQYIDDNPEWTNGPSEDSNSIDPSRCSLPTDNSLYSNNWGNSTIMKGRNYAQRRLAKINFHSSMSYKDRALHQAYTSMDDICKNTLGLNEVVTHDAKCMYRKMTTQKLSRGAVRNGIKANCVMTACKNARVPRTTKEIADAFGIPTKDISRTSELCNGITSESSNEVTVTKPSDIITRILCDLNIPEESYRKIRIKSIKLAGRLNECVPLMGKNPRSIAAAVIVRIIGDPSKTEIANKCGVSIPTLHKIDGIITKYLEV